MTCRHPRRGIATANIQHFFEMGKKKLKKMQNEAFFSLGDAAEPLQFRGDIPPTDEHGLAREQGRYGEPPPYT